jgi:predicted protein tyrosine phosphatase
MDSLTAHALLCQRLDRSALPCHCLIGGMDAWPAAATAAVALAGYLDDAQSDQDLDDGLEHFQTLCRIGGIIDAESWQRETGNVIAQLMAWGDKVTAGAGE